MSSSLFPFAMRGATFFFEGTLQLPLFTGDVVDFGDITAPLIEIIEFADRFGRKVAKDCCGSFADFSFGCSETRMMLFNQREDRRSVANMIDHAVVVVTFIEESLAYESSENISANEHVVGKGALAAGVAEGFGSTDIGAVSFDEHLKSFPGLEIKGFSGFGGIEDRADASGVVPLAPIRKRQPCFGRGRWGKTFGGFFHG